MQRVTLENETKVGLLYALKDFTTETVKGLLMPVKRQKQDEREPKRRTAEVHLARLPDMTSFEKKAPFILHQAVTGEDALKNANKGTGRESRLELQSSAVIRSVFCVYHPDEEEGGLALLNIMEEMRIALLMYPTLNGVFELDLKEGISQMVYPETGERGTAPFYLGEMVTAWKLPPVTRINAARVANVWLPPWRGRRLRGTRRKAGRGLVPPAFIFTSAQTSRSTSRPGPSTRGRGRTR